jgi:hypothetical protein
MKEVGNANENKRNDIKIKFYGKVLLALYASAKIEKRRHESKLKYIAELTHSINVTRLSLIKSSTNPDNNNNDDSPLSKNRSNGNIEPIEYGTNMKN